MSEHIHFSSPCAVIGANGYLGSHLAFILERSGCTVYRFDIHPESQFPANQYRKLDIRSKADFSIIPENTGTVFFFSGLTGTHAGFDAYEDYLASNELGLLHLLDCIREWENPPRVVFPSTRLVYRGSPLPLDEDAPKEAKTVYAANKLAAEHQLQAWSNRWGIPYTICRICVPYGTLFQTGYSFGTIGFFLKMARRNGCITLYGDGTSKRTFTHIEDLCNQVIMLAGSPDATNRTFNIAGEHLTLDEAAHQIAAHYGAAVEYTAWPVADLLVESGDTMFDDARIRRLVREPVGHALKEWIMGLKEDQTDEKY
ncbi:MAG: NAD-dependent epimerase/dehydratase family protein [Bacteroidales bacterium]